MRHARSCYDHLAGHLAVSLFEDWVAARVLVWRGEAVQLTTKGQRFLADRGIDVAALEKKRRPLCRTCIDWSERRNHLGGSVGAAVLSQILEHGWAVRDAGARTVRFSPPGELRFVSWYSHQAAA